MTDKVTVTTRRGCSNSIVGALFGIALFLASIPLLFWNEGRAVQTYNSLVEGAAAVINVSADTVNPVNEGKLVHVTGMATTAETLTDPDFGVSAPAIKLIREVQMYQWTESSKTESSGNTERTTYTYNKEWSSTYSDSSNFHDSGHNNPPMPYRSAEVVAQHVTLQAFTLSADLVSKMSGEKPLAVDVLPPAVSSEVRERTKVINGFFYIGGGTLESPQLGDLQVKFSVIEPTTVSVVAQQANNRLESYQTQAGDTIDLLAMGASSADEMFKTAQEENTIFTWLLRGVGFVMMFAGVAMLLGPLFTVINFVPFLGALVEKASLVVAFALTFLLSVIIIALAWLVYHPWIGVALLCLAGVVFGLIIGGVVLVTRAQKK
jgi:hypothetical protein